MKLKKQLEQLLARVAAMQIPIYAGNASFFLLLSVFPIVSLLLSLLPYTPLTIEHLLGLCAQLAPEWLLRLLEYFIGQRRADALVGLKGDAEPALRA